MNIIKLSATSSTNTYLKELIKNTIIPDGTVVVTHNQLQGRGQFKNAWQSQHKKSLTFSIYKEFSNFNAVDHFYISMAVSNSIAETLTHLNIPNVTVKWPNDIMAVSKKCCGILIEPVLKGAYIKHAVIGIGLNVNETNFMELPRATSLKIASKKDFDLDVVLHTLVENLLKKLDNITSNKQFIKTTYTSNLFKKDSWATFNSGNGQPFKGKISGVTPQGLLEVALEDGSTALFNLKEITYIY